MTLSCTSIALRALALTCTVAGCGSEEPRFQTASRAPTAGAAVHAGASACPAVDPALLEALLQVLDQFVVQGHTAIVIETGLGRAGWPAQGSGLGPEGGGAGGGIVAAGTPLEVAATDTHTGRALRSLIDTARD